MLATAAASGVAGLGGLFAWLVGSLGVSLVFAWTGIIATVVLLLPTVVVADRAARATRR